MMIAECCAEFEKLPCLLDVDILRNILYDGVWNHYKNIQKKTHGRKGKERCLRTRMMCWGYPRMHRMMR